MFFIFVLLQKNEMRILKYIYAIVLFTFVSCTNFDDVNIKFNQEDVKINSVKGSRFKLHIPVEIDNPTTKSLFLKKAKIDVFKNGYSFAKLELNEKLEIPANSNERYIITLDGRSVDAMSMMFSSFNFRNTQSENYTLNGFVKAGTKTFSKKVKFKNSNFETLINSFVK